MILKRDIQVATASDGKSAMALFDSFNPDLVLLDLCCQIQMDMICAEKWQINEEFQS